MRKKQDWMELTQDEINSMSDENWSHYEGSGCLCFAHDSSECVCGSYDRKPVKRKPLDGGRLPATTEELKEFKELFIGEGHEVISSLCITEKKDGLVLYANIEIAGYEMGTQFIRNIRAILWLNDRFDLVTK